MMWLLCVANEWNSSREIVCLYALCRLRIYARGIEKCHAQDLKWNMYLLKY